MKNIIFFLCLFSNFCFAQTGPVVDYVIFRGTPSVTMTAASYLDSLANKISTTSPIRNVVPVFGSIGKIVISNISDSSNHCTIGDSLIVVGNATFSDSVFFKTVPAATLSTDRISVIGTTRGTLRSVAPPTGLKGIVVTWPGDSIYSDTTFLSTITNAGKDTINLYNTTAKYSDTSATLPRIATGAYVLNHAGIGTVTSITAGYGLTGGTIISAGILMADSTKLLIRADSNLYLTPYASKNLPFATAGSITTPGIIFTNPITLTLSGQSLNGTMSLTNQSPNTFLAGATSGTTTPTFRGIVAADIPTLSAYTYTPGKYMGLTSNTFYVDTTQKQISFGNVIIGRGGHNQDTSNTTIGYYADTGLTTGLKNVAIGMGALNKITTQSNAVAIGYNAANGDTAGSIVAIGSGALSGGNLKANIVAIGQSSFAANTTGGNLVGVGPSTGAAQTSAQGNTYIGYLVGQKGNANFNTAVGGTALSSLTYSGQNNSIFGYGGGSSITTGSYNTLMGTWAGIASLSNTCAITDGQGNFAFYSGSTHNVLINPGTGSTPPTDDGANALQVIGNISIKTAGSKLLVAAGLNASIGTSSAMSSGTITVSTTSVTASSIIFLTGVGGAVGCVTCGSLSVGTITAGTSFVINSASATDTRTVNYWIIN